MPAHAEPASEFRYRNPVIESDTLYVAVSQSGETFDTLAAIQEVKRKGGRVLGIVNVVGSTIARECGRGIYLHAGPEIAVVATKTFTCTAGRVRAPRHPLGPLARSVDRERRAAHRRARSAPPAKCKILDNETAIAAGCNRRSREPRCLFVGRAAGSRRRARGRFEA